MTEPSVGQVVHYVSHGTPLRADGSMGGACVCVPTDTPVEQEDGKIRWLAVHHSLDGRELPPLA